MISYRLLILIALTLVGALRLDAQTSKEPLPEPVVMLIIVAATSIAPFAAIMLTSFVKIAVVLSILRNAMGTQNIPPTQVITGLSIVLTMFVMTPVAEDMYRNAGKIPNTGRAFSYESVTALFHAADLAKEPLRGFLVKHAHDDDRSLFLDLASQIQRKSLAERGATEAPPAASAASGPAAKPDDFRVVVPAFITSELKEAFQTGFLVYVPFLIVDLVVANILIAMGMQMLQPAYVALPFKILLFVLADGWNLIIRGLVLSYL